MPKIYCDHNFLIRAFGENDSYKEQLRATRATHGIELIFSTWHWVEMAKDQDRARGLDLADFADSLLPLWLRERRSIQTTEVAEALFTDINVPFQRMEAITTRTQVIVEMTNTTPEIAAHYNRSRPFVQYLQTDAGGQELTNAYRAIFSAQLFLRDAVHRASHQHRLTRSTRRAADRNMIKGMLPSRTPSGVPIDRKTLRSFARDVSLKSLPALAVETALFDDALQLDRALTERELRDRQHAISIPYVDFFVTDDGKLANAIYRITQELEFATAAVIDKAEFDRRFL